MTDIIVGAEYTINAAPVIAKMTAEFEPTPEHLARVESLDGLRVQVLEVGEAFSMDDTYARVKPLEPRGDQVDTTFAEADPFMEFYWSEDGLNPV